MSEPTSESDVGIAEGYLSECEAENKRLQKQVVGMRATLQDFADPDHWIQNDEGQWVWYGYYPPFERPAIDLLGTLDKAK